MTDELSTLKAQLAQSEQRERELRGAIEAAMKYANNRWEEWGERALETSNILEAALRSAPPSAAIHAQDCNCIDCRSDITKFEPIAYDDDKPVAWVKRRERK